VIERRIKPIWILIFAPIPVFVSVLESHALKRRMIALLLSCIPRRHFAGLSFAAIGVMAALVFWNEQITPTFGVFGKSKESLTAPALAGYGIAFSELNFWNKHMALVARYTQESKKTA
jgi:hypothetical protein